MDDFEGKGNLKDFFPAPQRPCYVHLDIEYSLAISWTNAKSYGVHFIHPCGTHIMPHVPFEFDERKLDVVLGGGHCVQAKGGIIVHAHPQMECARAYRLAALTPRCHHVEWEQTQWVAGKAGKGLGMEMVVAITEVPEHILLTAYKQIWITYAKYASTKQTDGTIEWD